MVVGKKKTKTTIQLSGLLLEHFLNLLTQTNECLVLLNERWVLNFGTSPLQVFSGWVSLDENQNSVLIPEGIPVHLGFIVSFLAQPQSELFGYWAAPLQHLAVKSSPPHPLTDADEWAARTAVSVQNLNHCDFTSMFGPRLHPSVPTESLNELEDNDLDALVADLRSKSSQISSSRSDNQTETTAVTQESEPAAVLPPPSNTVEPAGALQAVI